MNGKSQKSFALVLASFAVGAAVAGILGHPETRARIAEGGKNLVKRTKRLSKRGDVA